MIYTDSAIIQLFLPLIKAGLVSYGYGTIPVVQSNQPTMEGINTEATIYFYKVGNQLFGFPGVRDEWNGIAMQQTQTQQYLATFKVFALVLQSPLTPNQYTASDLVNAVAFIMQSQKVVTALNESGVSVLKISQVDNPYFTDDRDQYEATPSFDFILSYTNSIITTQPVLELPIYLDIEPV
jgi:hypothetical protein